MRLSNDSKRHACTRSFCKNKLFYLFLSTSHVNSEYRFLYMRDMSPDICPLSLDIYSLSVRATKTDQSMCRHLLSSSLDRLDSMESLQNKTSVNGIRSMYRNIIPYIFLFTFLSHADFLYESKEKTNT